MSADDAYEYDEKAVQKNLSKEGVWEALTEIRDLLAGIEAFEPEPLEALIRDFVERTGFKIWQLLRVALTGEARGPGLYEILELLGKESTIRRLDRTLTMLAAAG